MSTKVKEVNQKEVHWIVTPEWNVGPQANVQLKRVLGDLAEFFAVSKVGGNFFSWEDELDDWRSRATVNPATQAEIDRAWLDLQQKVRQRLANLPSKFVDKILSIPNEDYLFFRQNTDGSIILLVTGWGFRNFKMSTAGKETMQLPSDDSHPVSVAFTEDGVRIPNRRFSIKTPKLDVEHCTDDSGLFEIGKTVSNGRTMELTDLVSHRHFLFTVTKGQDVYEFDVTEKTTVSVYVCQDGEPLPGVECQLNYRGRVQTLVTDGTGRASMTVTLNRNEECSAIVRDQRQSALLPKEGYEFRFSFTTPPSLPPDPEPEQEPEQEPEGKSTPFHLKVVDANGEAIRNAGFTCADGADVLDAVLDSEGCYLLDRNRFAMGRDLTFTLKNRENSESTSLFLEENETDYLIQEQPVTDNPNSTLTELLVGIGVAALCTAAGFLLFSLI